MISFNISVVMLRRHMRLPYKVLLGNDRRFSTDNTRWKCSKHINQDIIPTTISDVENLDINDVLMQLLEKIKAFSGQNSCWTVSQVNYLRLCWGAYHPLEVGLFIPTPKHIAMKKAVVNICSSDVYCFPY